MPYARPSLHPPCRPPVRGFSLRLRLIKFVTVVSLSTNKLMSHPCSSNCPPWPWYIGLMDGKASVPCPVRYTLPVALPLRLVRLACDSSHVVLALARIFGLELNQTTMALTIGNSGYQWRSLLLLPLHWLNCANQLTNLRSVL